jgi:serine-type D-Ala-D-Ala carboxypeptidase (penicillin-binding protein 5/6)
MSARRLIAGALIVIASWAAAVVVAEPTDEGGDTTTAINPFAASSPGARAAVRSGQPPTSAVTPDSGTAPIPRNRLLVFPGHKPFAVRAHFKRPPRAGLLFDVTSGRVLWQLNPRRELPIASLTKMMTALVIAQRHRLKERVRITPATLHYQGSGVGVLPGGKRVQLRALLYGLLLVSGNDAAIALAQHDARTVGGFVHRMNQRARQLDLGCSHFSSPSGIRDKDNYSCPLDLATLARLDLANRTVRRIVGTRRARMRFPVKGHYLDLFNINPFIDDPGVTGVKTGLTNAAGRCYVITAHIGGRHLGVVLLNSPDPLRQVPRLMRAGGRAG